MIFSRRNLICRSLIFSALGLAGILMFSQATFAAVGAAPGESTNAAELVIIPKLKSPVAVFRELLAMSPAERRQALTNRPPEVQKRILAKLLEYESLKSDEREFRLRATELQWYLLPLMSLSGTNRASRLALIPEDNRKLVEARLAQWDLLPPPIQEQMLNNEMTARYFSQLETNRNLALSKMSPERRAQLEADLNRWRGLTEQQRQKTLDSFNAFFELTPREKEKALNTLTEAEQRQMEKTLQTYEKLSIEQRRQCISSFEKFTGMTVEERQSFLRNARAWKSMSPADRESWRKLVGFAPIQPPLPPRHLPLPPAPTPPRPRPPLAVVATND